LLETVHQEMQQIRWAHSILVGKRFAASSAELSKTRRARLGWSVARSCPQSRRRLQTACGLWSCTGINLPRGDWAWATARRKELYWGWFVPNQVRFNGLSLPAALKPIRDCSTLWFNTFQALTKYPDFSKRDVNGRLYRTWDHVRLYHAEGLRHGQVSEHQP
jgi:hypothetical protein